VFVIQWTHGSILGFSDDEAYYWWIGQRPAWGYAWHPPGVAWLVALFQAKSVAAARLPACLITALMVWSAGKWYQSFRVSEKGAFRGTLLVISFSGLFAVSWMIVPDLPLLLGYGLVWWGAWKWIEAQSTNDEAPHGWMLLMGAVLLMLSKFSGVLAIGSAGLAILVLSKRREWRSILKGWGWLVVGFVIGMIPAVLWNMDHDWGSFRYQFQERHTGSQFSASRYLRFWLLQWVLAGGAVLVGIRLLPGTVRGLWSSRKLGSYERAQKFCGLFFLPAFLVFCVQPGFSDFKFHWSLVVWLPVFLGWGLLQATSADQGRPSRIANFQTAWGIFLTLLSLVFMQVPVVMIFTKGKDPKWDLSNDFVGWDRLVPYLEELSECRDWPLVASRHQVAAQAAYYLEKAQRKIAVIPRDLKQRDEWEDLGVSDTIGPEWPKLLKPVLFLGDNRYGAAPEFREARCEALPGIQVYRLGMLGREIKVWKCLPNEI
jgi:hypothetical protein